MRRADPQRVKTSQNQRDDEHSTETARCCSGDHSPDQQFDGETVENKISHSTVQDVRGQNKTRLRDVTTTKKQTIQSTLPTAVIKRSSRMREKTVEFQQMHDIDEVVSSLCAETEDEPVATRTAEAHPAQFIGRVVDVPVDEEPGDAEDAGSCCTEC